MLFFHVLALAAADAPSATMRPTGRLMQAVDVLRRFMELFDFALYDGCIYRRPKEAKYTYVFCSSVHDFVHSALGNEEVAEAIATHTSTIISLLSVSTSRLIKPIEIDFNFIEVLPPGTLFDIEMKCFVSDNSRLRGKDISSVCILCRCTFEIASLDSE